MDRRNDERGRNAVRIAAVLIDRANYARMLPVLTRLRDADWCDLRIITGGSFNLRRFGRPWTMLSGDGLARHHMESLYFEVEGNHKCARVHSIGHAIPTFNDAFRRHDPQCVLIIGDRYEAMAAATAAFYGRWPICHLQSWERSGTTDDTTRDLITRMASWHVPGVDVSIGDNRLYHDEEWVWGCPSVDLAQEIVTDDRRGILVTYHPDDLNSGIDELSRFQQTMDAAQQWRAPRYVCWPNIDPGSDALAKEIRERKAQDGWITIKNQHPREHLELLASVDICVGNSSSFVREAGFFGTPAVIVGNRQIGRAHGAHAIQTDMPDIGMLRWHADKRFEQCRIYGEPGVSDRIVEGLKNALYRGGGAGAQVAAQVDSTADSDDQSNAG